MRQNAYEITDAYGALCVSISSKVSSVLFCANQRTPSHSPHNTFFVCFIMILYFQLINWVSFVLFLIFFFFLVRMPQIDLTKSSGNEFLASAHSTTNDICKIYLNSRELSVIPYAIDAHSHQSMIIFLLLFKRNIFKTPRTRFVYDF